MVFISPTLGGPDMTFDRRMPAKSRHLFLTLCFACLLIGCSQEGGPSLPRESIAQSLPEALKTAMAGLYDRDTDKVIVSINSIGEMGTDGSAAAPYLSTMLMDSRLGTVWIKGYGKTLPISKAAAQALGAMGPVGINALAGAVKGTSQVPGMEDDLLRESVAQGLDRAMESFEEKSFQSIKGTPEVDYLIQAARVCLALEESPGRFDKTDPRNSLKFFKHFNELKTREGLESFIKVLGLIGDARALALMASIFPLDAQKQKDSQKGPQGPFERAAVIAQYRISPLPLSHIHPPNAKILIIEFTAADDHQRVQTLLDEGLSPDILTRTGHPLIELAWKQEHPEMFDRLIKAGARVDLSLTKNDTLLIRSARKGDHDFAKALLARGADPSLTNNAKETALDAALSELLSFWNEKPYDTEAKPFFKTIELLRAAGSPPVNDKLLKDMDKKAKEFLKL